MDKKPRLNPPSILVALMVGLIIAVIIWAVGLLADMIARLQLGGRRAH